MIQRQIAGRKVATRCSSARLGSRYPRSSSCHRRTNSSRRRPHTPPTFAPRDSCVAAAIHFVSANSYFRLATALGRGELASQPLGATLSSYF